MNSRRNYNGWILCRSKSFPGKFYYFNVLNGEAAWSLSDIEKSSMPKHNNIQSANRWHTYPEPDCPPTEEGPTWPNYRPIAPNSRQQPPKFGQSAFVHPKVPEVWAQIPVQTITNPTMRRSAYTDLWNVGPNNQFIGRQDKNLNPFSRVDTQKNWFENPQLKAQVFSKANSNQVFYNPTQISGNSTFSNYDYKLPSQNVQESIFGRLRRNSDYRTFANQNLFGFKTHDRVFGTNSLDSIPQQSAALYQNQKKSNSMFNMENIYKEKVFGSLESLNFDPSPKKINPTLYCRDFFQRSVSHSGITKSMENLTEITEENSSPLNGEEKRSNFDSLNLLSKNFMYETQNLPSYNMPKNPRNRVQSEYKEIPKSRQTDKVELILENTKILNTETNIVKKQTQESKDTVEKEGEYKMEFTFGNTKILNSKDKTERAKKQTQEIKNPIDKQCELDNTDLRHVLLAKKRKTEDEEQTSVKAKKVKTHYPTSSVEKSTKKRVTFNLGVESEDESIAADNDVMQIVEDDDAQLTIESLRQLNEPWYIVVDVDTLLQDYEFIDQFLKIEENCTLVVPTFVRAAISVTSTGDCADRARVLAARHLTRRLASPPPYITVQSPRNDEPVTDADGSIINYCLEATAKYYYLVLVSNNNELLEAAYSVGLYTLKLQDIKDSGANSKPLVTFDLRKLQNEDSEKNYENHFFREPKKTLPTANEDKEDFVFGKRFNEDVFNSTDRYANKENRNQKLASKNVAQNHKDAFDDLSDSSMTTEINRHIKNLHLKDVNDVEDFVIDRRRNKNVNRNEYNKDLSSKSLSRKQMDFDKAVDIYKQTEKRDQKKSIDKDNLIPFPKEKQAKLVNYASDINSYTIESHLKRFCVNNRDGHYRIKTRLDEFFCGFSQIMEDCLTAVLQNKPIEHYSRPLNIVEAIHCIAELYGDHHSIRLVTDKMTVLLLNNMCENANLKPSILSNDFMKILGCGVLLIKCLKTIEPLQPELKDADDQLFNLIRSIEEPAPFIELNTYTPASRSQHTFDLVDIRRRNFVKDPSEVLDYLKKHFPAWQRYDESQINQKQSTNLIRTTGKNLNLYKINNTKSLVMTDSRNLDAEEPQGEDVEKVCKPDIHEKVTSGPAFLKHLVMNSTNTAPVMKNINIANREKINKDLLSMIGQMVNPSITKYYDVDTILEKTGEKNENADANQKKDRNNQSPILVGKFKLPLKRTYETGGQDKSENSQRDFKCNYENGESNKIDLIKGKIQVTLKPQRHVTVKENMINPNEKLDLEALDYSENDSVQSVFNDDFDDEAQNSYDNKNNDINIPHLPEEFDHTGDSKNKDNYQNGEDKQNGRINNENGEENNQNDGEIDNSISASKDSGIESEMSQLYGLTKRFFINLSGAYKNIYRFVDDCRKELSNKESIQNAKKNNMNTKAVKTNLMLVDILGNLKRIIDREADNIELRDMLSKAGEIHSDLRMKNYRQVIAKCLMQALVLQKAVKLIMAETK